MVKHSLPCGYVFRGRYLLRLFLAFAFILLSLLLIVNWVQLRHSHRSMILPTKEKMASMSHNELIYIYDNFMNIVTFHCKNIIRAGTIGDGGWNVCVDPEYRPKKPCLVYSFGIDWDSSFDLAVHKKFNCEVHSFDPTLNDAQLKEISPLLNFHQLDCLVKTLRWQTEAIIPCMKFGGCSDICRLNCLF